MHDAAAAATLLQAAGGEGLVDRGREEGSVVEVGVHRVGAAAFCGGRADEPDLVRRRVAHCMPACAPATVKEGRRW